MCPAAQVWPCAAPLCYAPVLCGVVKGLDCRLGCLGRPLPHNIRNNSSATDAPNLLYGIAFHCWNVLLLGFNLFKPCLPLLAYTQALEPSVALTVFITVGSYLPITVKGEQEGRVMHPCCACRERLFGLN